MSTLLSASSVAVTVVVHASVVEVAVAVVVHAWVVEVAVAVDVDASVGEVPSPLLSVPTSGTPSLSSSLSATRVVVVEQVSSAWVTVAVCVRVGTSVEWECIRVVVCSVASSSSLSSRVPYGVLWAGCDPER